MVQVVMNDNLEIEDALAPGTMASSESDAEDHSSDGFGSDISGEL